MNQITEHVYSVDAGALSVFLVVLPEALTLIDAGFPGTMALVGASGALSRQEPGGDP